MQGNFCNEPPEALRQTWWSNTAKMSSISGYDFQPIVAEIDAPILVIKGTEAGLPPAWIQPWAFSAPNGRMLWIEEAGYAVWIEAPDRVFPAILEFIAGKWPDGVVDG
jgi:pimeloyl-ACP methyl ester carboxylesterase